MPRTVDVTMNLQHFCCCYTSQLDAGVPEKVCLMSRDEQSVLVVTYADLKQCFESAIGEVLQASQPGSSSHGAFS